jgi:hypothetical protein
MSAHPGNKRKMQDVAPLEKCGCKRMKVVGDEMNLVKVEKVLSQYKNYKKETEKMAILVKENHDSEYKKFKKVTKKKAVEENQKHNRYLKELQDDVIESVTKLKAHHNMVRQTQTAEIDRLNKYIIGMELSAKVSHQTAKSSKEVVMMQKNLLDIMYKTDVKKDGLIRDLLLARSS